jgi:hypothetical protein
MRQMVSTFRETAPMSVAPRNGIANVCINDQLGKMLTTFNLFMKSMAIYDDQT